MSKDASHVTSLKSFFDRDVCQKGTRPLRKGVEIALYYSEENPITLQKTEKGAQVFDRAPVAPDISCYLSDKSLSGLLEIDTEDVGELGVGILKLMAHPQRDTKITTRVHIGLIKFLRNGYLGILPLGGATVMKFLASKGFNNIGKIKKAIGDLREAR